MDEHTRGARIAPLADCPYCGGEGADPKAPLGLCQHCYGTGRVARFLAERTLERWAKGARDSRRRTGGAARREGDERDGIEDEVPPRYRSMRSDGAS